MRKLNKTDLSKKSITHTIILVRNKWHLARVVKIFEGCDGMIRSAIVKTSSTEFHRPIVKFLMLESMVDTICELMAYRMLIDVCDVHVDGRTALCVVSITIC